MEVGFFIDIKTREKFVYHEASHRDLNLGEKSKRQSDFSTVWEQVIVSVDDIIFHLEWTNSSDPMDQTLLSYLLV